MPLREALDLDPDEFQAWRDAVDGRERQRAWSQDTELLAGIVELLHTIANDLRRGVPVVQVKKQARAGEAYRVKRPSWITRGGGESAAEEIVVSPRELFRRLST